VLSRHLHNNPHHNRTMPEEPPTQDDAVAVEEPPKQVDPKDDPLLQALWRDLGKVEDTDEKPIEPAPEAETPESAGESATSEANGEDKLPLPEPEVVADEAKAEAKDKFEIRHQPMLTEDRVRDVVKEAVAEVAPAPKESVTPPEEIKPNPEDDLLEDQREELEVARIAEKSQPDKYKGLPDKLLGYYSKLEDYITNGVKENPERSFDEDDMDYQDWVSRNRPRFTDKDRARAEQLRTENRAYERARQEVASEVSKLEKRQKALELKPKIDEQIDKFGQSILQAGDSDASKAIAKNGFDAAADSHPLESAVFRDTVERAKGLASEYLGFANGLSEFDYNNPTHKWLLEFINHNGEWFEANGGEARNKGGKSFVNRAKYAELHAAGKAGSYWTFDHDDVLHLLSANALHEANHQIKTTLDAAEKYGFVKQQRPVSAEEAKAASSQVPPQEDLQPIHPPKATPSVGPGNADPDTSPENRSMGADVLQTLGMR